MSSTESGLAAVYCRLERAEANESERLVKPIRRIRRSHTETASRTTKYPTHQCWYRDDSRHGDAPSLRRLRERESAALPDSPPA